MQIQEEQERSRAAAAKHDSVLEQLGAERTHILELDSQIESQHKVCLQPFSVHHISNSHEGTGVCLQYNLGSYAIL